MVENIARSEIIDSKNYYRSYDIPHYQFEWKLHLLENKLKNGEKVNCFILGSSLVVRGIDPEVINEVYFNKVGEKINCFNFGVDGMKFTEFHQIASFLSETFHPDILIFGISPRAFDKYNEISASNVFSSDWILYAQGEYTFRGWMLHNIYSYQYLQTFFVSYYDSSYKKIIKKFEKRMTNSGYAPFRREFDADILPEPLRNLKNFSYSMKEISEYIKLNNSRTMNAAIYIVEMPVTTKYITNFNNGREGYFQTIDKLVEYTVNPQVKLIRTNVLPIVGDDGFMDLHHLNIRGAEIFSNWLAIQISNQE